MLAFNFFFLPPLHTLTLATRGTGSRSPSSSSPRSSSASSPPDAAPRARSRRCSREIATSLLERGPCTRRARPDRRRGGQRAAGRAGDGSTVGDRRGSRSGAERYPLAAGDRRVGSIDLAGAAARRAPRRGGGCSRRSARCSASRSTASGCAGGRRGRGAAPERRAEDRGAPLGQPRPAHAADGDPDPARALARERPRARRGRPRRAAGDDPRRGRAARPPRRRTCSTSRACRPARSAAETALWALDDLVVQALGRARAGVRRGSRCRCPTTLADRQVDAQQVERVLVNVIENAIKYSPPAEPVERAGRRPRRDGVVRVIDHGPGIGRRELERIFEPFIEGPRARCAARARPRHRPRLHRGERRPRLGRVAARPGRDLRARSCRVAGSRAMSGAADPRRRRRAADPARAADQPARGRATRSRPPTTADGALAAAAAAVRRTR